MKKMRRFAAIAAAAAMTACMAVPMMSMMSAGAIDITTGTVTVSNEATGHEYTAYQIFDGTLTKDSDTSPVVFSDVKWGTGTDSNTISGIYAELSALNILGTDNKNIFKKYANDADTTGSNLTSAAEVADALKSVENGTDDEKTNIDKIAAIFSKYVTGGTKLEYVAASKHYTKANLDAGYYLVIDTEATGDGMGYSDALSRYMLQVADSVTIDPKASAPIVHKKVLENEKDNAANWDDVRYGNYNDVADYTIGEDINFVLRGTVPETINDYDHYFYEFGDSFVAKQFKLLDGTGSVTPNVFDAGDVVVEVDGKTIPASVTIGGETHENYTVTEVKTGNDVTGFKVTFKDIRTLYATNDAMAPVTVTSSSYVYAKYKAELTADSKVGLDGNVNTVDLTFSSNPNQNYNPWDADTTNDTSETNKAAPDSVIVFTYGLDVTKYLNAKAEGNEVGAGLAGFKLQAKSGEYTGKWAIVNTTTNKIEGWADTEAGATEVLTKEGGKFGFVGLDDGEYLLKETKTPGGYNTMDDLSLTITATTVNDQNWTDGVASKALTALKLFHGTTEVANAGDTATGLVSDAIVNKAGSSLPSTGGIGTTLFYVIGGTLAAGAGVGLIAKKRMKNEE